jgi:hypothetical protein
MLLGRISVHQLLSNFAKHLHFIKLGGMKQTEFVIEMEGDFLFSLTRSPKMGPKQWIKEYGTRIVVCSSSAVEINRLPDSQIQNTQQFCTEQLLTPCGVQRVYQIKESRSWEYSKRFDFDQAGL